MAFGSFFADLMKAIAAFVQWLQQGQLLKAGKLGAEAVQLEEQVREIETAVAVRESVRHVNSTVPVADSLPDDGFRRD